MPATEYPEGDIRVPAPVIQPGHTYRSVTEKLVSVVLTRNTPFAWFVFTAIGFTLVMGLLVSITYLLFTGVGIWGNNIPVGWAFPIINFVWWIGIGHAGTLISAILLLFKQDWRTSINRFAEAMTLFAVLCAALFPLIHTGRPWLAVYWLFPYPNVMGVWPNFRSPLIWDVFAVSTYGSVSLLFWFVGLVPDLATFRDKATNPFLRKAYGILALGWRGSARHWYRFESAYLILAGLSTPLVLSVHTVVSFDFASAIIPGWHATIFPPYFVAGAIYAGFAMVLTLAIPLRAIYKLHDFITMRHIENMAKVMLVTGLIVVYGYFSELFFGWYSGDQYERFLLWNRTIGGPFHWTYWVLLLCNFLVPQLMWLKKMRMRIGVVFMVAMFINVGMWLERFVIIVTSMHRDFLPSSWEMYSPTFWDFTTFFGTVGLFLTLMFLFVRVLPMISDFRDPDAAAPEARIAGGRRAELMASRPRDGFYGLMAEFQTEDAVLAAAHKVHDAGYTRTDAFSPYPVHGLAEALGMKERRVAPIVLVGGILGALAGYGLEYWTQAIDYPMNIAGRPLNAWVAFIPPTFETTVLFAAFSAGLGMLALNGLPRPHHPVFNAPRFQFASQDRFFLAIEASDPRFDREATGKFLAGLNARDVVELDE